jgi:hypothetical protein
MQIKYVPAFIALLVVSSGGILDESGSFIIVATGTARVYELTSADDGVMFDLGGDGVKEPSAWTDPKFGDVAFLAMDRNGNGTIDDGSELFGDHTIPAVGNGFAALLRIRGRDEHGTVNRDDSLFDKLLLWYDRNHNGISERDELVPVFDKLEAIGLGYHKRRKSS